MVKKGKTKLQIHQEKKKELAESLEYLRQVETPDGRKFVHDKRVEEKKEEQSVEDQIKNFLESRRQARYGYRNGLAEYGFTQLLKIDDDKWDLFCVPTDGSRLNIFGTRYPTQEGILVVAKSPMGTVYHRGITMTYDPEIDMGALKVLIIQVENTIDAEKGILLSDNKDTHASLKKTKDGLYIPN